MRLLVERKDKARGVLLFMTRKRKSFSDKFKKQIIERDKSHCQICGRFIDTNPLKDERNDFGKIKIRYHFDHIIPFAQGGSDDMENLRLVCPPCNFKRNQKHGKYS